MILVTGASGLLGANLLWCACNQGREVVGIYRGHPLRIIGVPMYSLDLIDLSATRKILVTLKPECIVHCAAATNVDWCEDHPAEAERINAQASIMLAQTAHEIGASFLYISTDAVFDGKRGNYSETDESVPINTYGISKLKGEQGVFRSHPSALVARVNIYGWNAQDKYSLAEWILHELENSKKVPGFTDICFTPMLVNDLVEVLLSMLDAGLSGLYHVTGGGRISKYEFAQRLATLFGFDSSRIIPVKSAEAKLRAPRPADISLNSKKIIAALGHPMPDVDSGLRRFHALREMGYPQELKSFTE